MAWLSGGPRSAFEVQPRARLDSDGQRDESSRRLSRAEDWIRMGQSLPHHANSERSRCNGEAESRGLDGTADGRSQRNVEIAHCVARAALVAGPDGAQGDCAAEGMG